MTATANRNGHIAVDDVKSAARGRWLDVLTSVGGFNADDLDGRHHPCPRCEGTDRFRAFDDVDETGGVLCNQCHSEDNGDGLAAIQWRNGWTFGETIKAVAGYLDINGGERRPADIVAEMARIKRMPLESFKAFGAKADQRGKLTVARVPMFDQQRKECGYFDLSGISPEFLKGMNAKKPLTPGLFVETWPNPGDVVLVTEGVKDSAALHSLGFKAVGLPTCKMAARFARVFSGCHVVIVPDRDTTGEDSAKITAARLKGVAASVRIATLPGEMKAKDGDGVREVLALKDGEAMLRQAIEDAVVWQPTTEAEAEPDDVGDEWTMLREAKGRTDRANSRRFLNQFGDRVRFCHPWSKWLTWDGSRWQIDDGGAVMRLAMATADSVWHDAKECLTKDVVDFAVATSGHGKLSAMLKLAAADVPVAVDDLDANPWLLNCSNGTVDLRTGELRPHRREDNLTKLCPTNFNPDVGSYHFDRFLEGVFDGSTIDFVQRFFGYCLTGDVREHILAVFHGIGSNGKSTLLKAIEDTLGTDFSAAAPPSLLIEKKTEAHPTELAGLFGKRLVIAQETNHGARLAEATVKLLTGGDIISARRMREDFWTFPPTHKVVLVTNHRPRIVGNDHAIWRRITLVPFARKFWNPDKGETGPAELRQDKTLPVKLKAEAEGILAWMVQGCLEWQRSGLQIPDSVRAATAEYRSEQDTLGRFAETCCIRSNAVRVKFSSLYGELEKWCNDGCDNVPSKRFVGSWLKDNGFKEHTNNGRWYLGIALKAETEQP